MTTVVHIGLGKTGTTTLQRHVFPRLHESGRVGRYNAPEAVRLLAVMNMRPLRPEETAALRAHLSGEGDRFFSQEGLVDWDPQRWEEACARNLDLFGSEAVIVITIREPRAYLTSIYQQRLHQRLVKTPEEFFLEAGRYAEARGYLRPGALDALDVDAFDLERLVSLYAARFRRVIVVSMEGVRRLEFLRAIWPLEKAELEALRAAMEGARRENISYSDRAMRLTFARERLLRRFGLRSLELGDRRLATLVQGASPGRGEGTAAFSELSRGEKLRQAPGRLRRRVAARAGAVFRWRRLMALTVDRLPGGGRYRLPESVPLGARFEANAAYYAAVAEAPGGFVEHARDGEGAPPA